MTTSLLNGLRPIEFRFPARVADPPEICEWAEENIRVVSGTARPGVLRLDPYQKEMLSAMADPEVRQVTMMLASQLGKTLKVGCLIGYTVVEAPKPTLMMFANDNHRKKFLREKMTPLLASCPAVMEHLQLNNRGRIPASGFEFQGTYCTFGLAGSRSDHHGTSAKLVLADEIDDYLDFNLLDSLSQRSASFKDSKLIALSTPTDKGNSRIEKEFMAGTQERFYVPCQHCEVFQLLRLGYATPEGYGCPYCGVMWSEEDRQQSLRRGDWRAEMPENYPHRSFQLSQLYSVAVPVENTLAETKKYSRRHVCTQIEAEPYEDVQMPELKKSQVHRKELDFQPAYSAVGVDVQQNRLEYSAFLFNDILSRKHLCYRGVQLRDEGYASMRNMRRDLARVLSRYTRLPSVISVDGSYEYDWVLLALQDAFPEFFPAGQFNHYVEIVRGYPHESFDKPLRSTRFVPWVTAATDCAKVYVQNDLRHGMLTIYPEAPEDTEAQLVSEKQIGQEVHGKVKKLWVPTGEARNEVLDCAVYAYTGVLRVAANVDLKEKEGEAEFSILGWNHGK